MAQHDYDIANQSGAAFRADLNNALSAIATINSGATAPTTTFAYQLYADTAAGQLKQRNSSNSAWVVVGTLGSVNLGLATLAGPTFTDNVTIQKSSQPQLILNSTAVGSWKSYIRWNSNGAAKWEIGSDIYSAGNNNLYFYDNAAAAERARFDSNGNLLIGTTSLAYPPNPGVSVQGIGVIGLGNNAGASGFAFVNFARSNALLGGISQNGTTGVSYTTSSDYRLKENIVDLSDAADRILQLRPSRFNFVSDPGRIVDGFIAHEAQSVVPESVTGSKDAVDAEGAPIYQAIDQSKLVPLLTAAIQEAIKRIAILESEVASLRQE